MPDVTYNDHPEETSLGSSDFVPLWKASAGRAGKIGLSNLISSLAAASNRVVSITSSGTIQPDSDTTDVYIVTALATNASILAPSGSPQQGQLLTIRIKDDGTSRTLSWASAYRKVIDPLPTVTPADTTIYLDFIYNSTDGKWDMVKKTVDRLGLITSITTSSAPTPNVDNCDMYIITALASAAGIQNPTGTAQQGQKLVMRIKDNGAARSLSWGSQYRAIGQSLPSATTASKTMYMGFIYNAEDTKWDMVALAVQS